MPFLRSNFGLSRCADPRDRIFALPNLGVVPDYTRTKTHLDVYEEVTRWFVNNTLGLHILSECEMNNKLLSERSGSSIPSWVPDWSTGNPYMQPLDTINRYT